MHRLYFFTFLSLLFCIGCEWHLKSGEQNTLEDEVVVERYDRIESLYLTTGDFSALQHMNTTYPQQTRTLIEDILQIGRVNEPEINTKFLRFFQDTTLQTLITDVEQSYANMDDVNQQLAAAFVRLSNLIPNLPLPEVYAQITSLDQSIVVGNGFLGISLDKYMGKDYPLYKKYGYSSGQRQSMTRSYIVPDCIGFYLLSLYPMPVDRELTQQERDQHIGKIQWTVNRAMGSPVFMSPYVRQIDSYMRQHKEVSVEDLLRNNDYASLYAVS